MKKIISLLLCLLTLSVLLQSCGSETPDASPFAKPLEPEKSINSGIEPVEPLNSNEKTVVSFLAVGDVLIHESVYNDAKKLASASPSVDLEYYFDPMYDNVKSKIAKADIAFANHESPIAGRELGISAYPAFNTPSESGDTLVRLGFDVVNIANNHMLDADSKGTGLKNTLDYWDAKTTDSFKYIGGYRNEADYSTPRLMNVKGMTISFLSYTYDFLYSDAYRQGTYLNPATPELVIPIIREDTIKAQIERAKECSDVVIVSMHWGIENQMTPNAEQKRYAKIIADSGADVIIGHHSHTLQPVEWIEGEGGNRTLCIYSLGNFISTQINSYQLVGGMMTFDIVREGNKKPYIENPIMEPTVCHYVSDPSKIDSMGLPTRSAVKIYLLKDYNETLAKQHGAHACGASFTYDKLKQFYTDAISSEFRPFYFAN